MINQDDEDAEENEDDEAILPKPRMQDMRSREGQPELDKQQDITNIDMSPGTYRNNIQTHDFEEVGRLIDGNI